MAMCLFYGLSLFLSINIFSVFSNTCGPSSIDCGGAEIVFVADSSGSIGTDGWVQTVNFINEVILDIGNSGTYGIIEFDSDSVTIFDLCDTSQDENCQIVLDTLNALPNLNGGGTNIPDAVQSGINMFGNCPDATLSDILILLTDGSGGDPCSLKTTLDSMGIKVFIVKVGTNVNSIINCLVDDTVNDIFDVTDFNQLSNIVTQLTTEICQTPAPTEEDTQPLP